MTAKRGTAASSCNRTRRRKWDIYGGIAATYARHTYAFDRPSISDPIQSGDDVDTAPRTLGSVRFGYNVPRWQTELEWIHNGGYYLDAANDHEYGGHNLLNIRAVWRVQRSLVAGAQTEQSDRQMVCGPGGFRLRGIPLFPGPGPRGLFPGRLPDPLNRSDPIVRGPPNPR